MAQESSMHRMFRPFHSLLRRKEVVAVDLTLGTTTRTVVSIYYQKKKSHLQKFEI